jgi:hypothetical protein
MGFESQNARMVAAVNWWQGKPHSRQRGRNTKFTSRATILA